MALLFFVLFVCRFVCLGGWVGWFVGWLICLVCYVLISLGLICFGLVWFVEFVLLVGWMVG